LSQAWQRKSFIDVPWDRLAQRGEGRERSALAPRYRRLGAISAERVANLANRQ